MMVVFSNKDDYNEHIKNYIYGFDNSLYQESYQENNDKYCMFGYVFYYAIPAFIVSGLINNFFKFNIFITFIVLILLYFVVCYNYLIQKHKKSIYIKKNI